MRPKSERVRYYVLATFIVICFLMGGGSRDDIQSLILLRPLAVLMCGYGLATITLEQVREHRSWLLLMALTLLVPLLQLVPLPPAVWHMLPGRDIIADIDAAAGIEGTWRPLSMVPATTWNAVYSLTIPIGVLLVGLQLPTPDRARLLPVVLVVGLISALLGLLQAIGSGGMLYFYRITNADSAVGLFSNRNHQAFFLATLLPMLAAWAAAPNKTPHQLRMRAILAAGTGAILFPMILVTGSRAGLALSVLGGVAGTLLYLRSKVSASRRQHVGFDWRLPLAGLGVVLLGLATILASRAEAVKRLLDLNVTDDLRVEILPVLLNLSWRYLPFGTGFGTFVEVFRMHEPTSLLAEEYVNHAHNDLLELVITGGIPGVLLLAAWVLQFARKGFKAWRMPWPGNPVQQATLLYGRCSAVCVAILLLASVTDYPLRTPSIAALVMLLVLWLHDATGRVRTRSQG